MKTQTAAIAALLVFCAPAWAQVAPPLGTDAPFAIVSSTFTNGPNAGALTAITGNVCFTTAPVTPPVSTIGVTTTPCAPQTGVDQAAATAILIGQPCTSLGAGAVTLNAINVGLGPGIFPPGCYSSGGAMLITLGTTVTLTGNGVYIFRPGGALTTGANSIVGLAGGACAGNVFWAPIATSLGANSTFVGNIYDNAGITIGNIASLNGRALTFANTLTTAAVTITVPAACAPLAGPALAQLPTLSEWAMIMLAALLALAGFAAIRRRAR